VEKIKVFAIDEKHFELTKHKYAISRYHMDLDDLKIFHPKFNIIHLIVDTRYDSPEDWYVISVEKR